MNTITPETKEKTVNSILFSCTLNITLIVCGVYLAYLSLVWAYQNWSMISGSIASFFLIFKTAKDFLVSHIGKLFIVWSVLTALFMCLNSKLNEGNLAYDSIEIDITDVLMFLVPFLGFIVFGTVPFKLDSSLILISVISSVISFVCCLFWICIVGIHLDNIFSKKEYCTVMEARPEQLKLDLL